MKRRAKMLFRAACWTLGIILGAAIDYGTTGTINVGRFAMFWAGMMLAAIYVHFDPPEVETWERFR